MNSQMLDQALKEGRIFKIGRSFAFVAQIPDDSVGCSGSRCSNCGGAVAYCQQLCKHCRLPFVGPFNFPQWPKWQSMTLAERRAEVEEVYCHHSNQGRLVCLNVPNIPLTSDDIGMVERLRFHDAHLFLSHHGVAPQGIRQVLVK